MPDCNILEKYPEQKPICFNYAEARGLIIALHDENANLRVAILDEMSGFLQNAGFEEASKALDCHYNL